MFHSINTSGKKTSTIYFMIGGDGCIFENGRQLLLSQSLVEHMVGIIKANPEAQIYIGRTGSLRGSPRMDIKATRKNQTGHTYHEAITLIAEEVRRQTERKIIVDDYTLTHTMHHILSEETTLTPLQWVQDCFRDTSLVLPLYATSHRSASQVDGDVEIHSYVENKYSLSTWNNVFNQQKKQVLLPEQVRVSCHHYHHGALLEQNVCQIQGAGETNRNYHQGIKQLALLAKVPVENWYHCDNQDYVAHSLSNYGAKEILAIINAALVPVTPRKKHLICEQLEHCIAHMETRYVPQAKALHRAVSLANSSQEIEELIYKELALFTVFSESLEEEPPPLLQQDNYYHSLATIGDFFVQERIMQERQAADDAAQRAMSNRRRRIGRNVKTQDSSFKEAIDVLIKHSIEGARIIRVLTVLKEGQDNYWNPYWMNSGVKFKRVIDAVLAMKPGEKIQDLLGDKNSTLYQALNMRRLAPLTFLGRFGMNHAKSLMSVQEEALIHELKF